MHVFDEQIQPVPDIEASVRPPGRFSVTVTVPPVETAEGALLTVKV
jgi:hypothetical protein